MVGRNHKIFSVEEAAATIVYECMLKGKSCGWSGDDDLWKVRDICEKHNVIYVSDWFGEFAMKNN